MKRSVCLALMIALAAIVGAVPAGASSTQVFKAQFQDSWCGEDLLCGKGVVQGFGGVTTTVTVTDVGELPDGCLRVSAVRELTLSSDGSTLSLAIDDSLVCEPRFSGTFTIIGGTGVFSGATGGGELYGTLTASGDSIHFRGAITL